MTKILCCCVLFHALYFTAALKAQPANALPFDRGVRVLVSTAKPAVIKGGDYDDKMQRISIKVKFNNVDTRQSYENYRVTVSAIGQSAVNRRVFKVLTQEQFPLTLAPLKDYEHTCKEVHTRFDKTGAVFGFAYDGWLVVVKDADGKVVYVKSTSPTFEKLTDKVDKITQDGHYDRSLEPVDAPAY